MTCLTKEIWKEIPSFQGTFLISSLGRVKRKPCKDYKGGILLGGMSGASNHKQVTLSFKNNKKIKLVHSLVMEAFKGKTPIGFEINHKDGDKSNNRLRNLEFLTHRDNMLHAYRNGLVSNKKERNGRSKITMYQAKAIRKQYPYFSVKKLSKKYHLSVSNIYAILNNKLWKE